MRQEHLHVLLILVGSGQSMHSERVTQVVQPRLIAGAVVATDTSMIAQPLERTFHQCDTASMLIWAAILSPPEDPDSSQVCARRPYLFHFNRTPDSDGQSWNDPRSAALV